ncbi:MAG TPA: type-F conjugative transfer system secretin TraK, partial [Candidatus Hydrogenedentes bacterium]|nr:type-F conjugative transfer system secretin TraK [Candidatus Hydrogenedentota bacterium]
MEVMMRRIQYLLCLAMIVTAVQAHAIQVITPVEGESTFVNIAKGELNLIQFPFNGIRAFTSSQKLDLKIQGRQVWVTMTDQNEGKPQEVFLSTPYGTYLMMMVPKSIPAETIVMKIDKEATEEAAEWEREHDYTKRLKELVKALYTGVPPGGYALRSQKKDASMWEGIEQTMTTTMTGAGLVGEVHELINH